MDLSLMRWIAYSGLGDIPPEDANFPASSGLEGEPASRFPLPTVRREDPPSLPPFLGLSPCDQGGAPPLEPPQVRSEPAKSARVSGSLSPSGGRGTVPAPPLDGFLRDIPSVLRAAIRCIKAYVHGLGARSIKGTQYQVSAFLSFPREQGNGYCVPEFNLAGWGSPGSSAPAA